MFESDSISNHIIFLFFQMVPGGTAAKSGKLRVGDRILKVNGTDVTQATHQEAVMELLRPGDYITLTIRHDPLPDGYQVSFVLTIPNSYMFSLVHLITRMTLSLQKKLL